MAEEIELRLVPFRGGPVDGRQMPIPFPFSPNRTWSVPTVGGVWVGDRPEGLPEDIETVDYRSEDYLRVGEGDDAEYVHESLVTADDDPPDYWLSRLNAQDWTIELDDGGDEDRVHKQRSQVHEGDFVHAYNRRWLVDRADFEHCLAHAVPADPA
jgi:hypothetical protein